MKSFKEDLKVEVGINPKSNEGKKLIALALNEVEKIEDSIKKSVVIAAIIWPIILWSFQRNEKKKLCELVFNIAWNANNDSQLKTYWEETIQYVETV